MNALIPLEQVTSRLLSTEPMVSLPVTTSQRIRFTLEPNWALGLSELMPDEPVDVYLDIDDDKLQLTKEAALQAGAAFGLTGAYMSKTPATLIEPHLNYWYGAGMGENSFALMVMPAKARGYAFTKPTVKPFSNVALLNTVIQTVRERYSGEIEADFKFHHSLTETNIRLVLTDLHRHIEFEDDSFDRWCGGITLTNSLVGKKMTTIDGYLFREDSQGGVIQQIALAGVWSRKSQGQHEELVHEWAKETVTEVLLGLKEAFDKVQALTYLHIEHNLGEVLREVFDTHKVPVTQRTPIIEELTMVPDPTMYDVQKAISRTANDPSISPARAETLMRIAGNLSAGVFDPVKAKVWREGNQAPRGARSPYEIEVAAGG